MYEIKVEGNFSAAHQLRNYKGKCEKLHGHNWRVLVSVATSKVDKAGMVIDFNHLKALLNCVLQRLDHKLLNDIEIFKKTNPTSENIAKFIFDELKSTIKNRRIILKSVSVYETDTSCAIYSS